MFVYLNAFDYDELLNGIVTHLGLQDEPLTYEMLLKAFKSVSERLKRRNDFVNNYLLTDNDPVGELVDKYLEFKRLSPIDTEMTEQELLVSILTGASPKSIYEGFFVYNVLTKHFPEVGNEKDDYFLDIDPEEASAYAEVVLELIDEHQLTPQDDLDQFIEKQIKDQLIGDEAGRLELTVIDSPGKKVNFGNALITFPILLAKVEHYEIV